MKTAIAGWLSNPWLTLTPIIAIAMAFRLYDLNATTLIADEPADMAAAIGHADYVNPFAVPNWLQTADPSQTRLPYVLTALSVRLLSQTGPTRFWARAGQVDCPPTLATLTLVTGVALPSLVFCAAAPAPLGRWAGLLPLAVVLTITSILGWPRLPADQLVAGRVVAGLVGTAGIAVTYLLGREVFGHWAGLYAAAALAVSTTHIGWSRCAVTTGDTFVTTFFTLAIWLLYRSARRKSGPAMMACAAAMGLALGAKLSAILLWPVCAGYLILLSLRRWRQKGTFSPETPDAPPACGDRHRARAQLTRATVLHAVLLLPLILVFFWPVVVGPDRVAGRFAVWAIALAAYLIGFVWVVHTRWWLPERSTGWTVFNLLVGGAVASAFATPYQLRMEVIGGLATWLHDYGARSGYTPHYALDLLSTGELLLVFTGFPANLLAVAGLIWAGRRANREWGILVLLTTGTYAAAVILLHHKAAYYLVPLLPLLHVVAGGLAAALIRQSARRRWFGATVLGAALCLCLVRQSLQSMESHPYYLLEDSRWRRYLPFSPNLGPQDVQLLGARPVAEWLAYNAPPGSRIAFLVPPEPSMRLFEMLATAVMTFEVHRLPDVHTKRLIVQSVTDPGGLTEWKYVILFPGFGALPRHLSDYDLAYEARLGDTTAAKVFKRRPPRP